MADNEAWVLDGLALNDGTALTLEAVDMTPPPELEEWVKGADTNGALLAREPLCDNRTITMTLRVERTATMDLALAKIGLVVDKLKECQRNANGLALTYLPHDSALTALTVRCLSGQITGIPVDITSGWLVNTPSLQLKLTCLPFFEGAEVTSYLNETTNPGIEVNTTGYGTAASFRTNTGATLTRVTTEHHSGVAALRVVTTATAIQGVDYTTVSVVAGVPKTVSVWAKGNAGGEAVTLLLGDGTVGNASTGLTLTTSWQRMSVTLTPTATGTTGVAVTQNTATVKTFFLDDWVIVNGSTAPQTLDGDLGTGYVWLGTTGLSASAGPNAVLSTEPIVPLELSSIAGDVPATGRLVVTDNASQSRRYVSWGLESRWYPTSSAPSLTLDSTSMVTTGFSGTTATQSGAYSGASNNVIQATLRTQPQAVCGLGNLSHIGAFRPHLRFYASAATMAVRLTYQTLNGPFRSLSYQVPVAVGWNHMDLGLIKIPQATLGAQRWTGRIDAYSTGTGGETIGVDAMWLMPAEQFARARGIYAYQPGALIGYDEFSATTSGSNLNARAAPLGGSWTTSGSTTDLQFADLPTGLETVTRATTSDASRRVAVLGSALAAVDNEVAIDAYATVIGSQEVAVLARWVDASNYLSGQWFNAGGSSTYRLMAVVAGAGVGFQTIPITTSANTWYTLTVVVYASGVAVGLMTDRAGVVLASARIQHSSLATGGVLASGKPGFYDYNSTASAVTRYYDNFYLSTPQAEPIVCYSGQSIQFSSDSTLREDSTGVYAGPPPDGGIGSRFTVPNSGGPNRKARIAAMARRNDVGVTTDDNIADSLLVQASYTPRYLVVPYE